MIKLREETIGRYSSERKALAYAAASRQASRWIDVRVEREGDLWIVRGTVSPLKATA